MVHLLATDQSQLLKAGQSQDNIMAFYKVVEGELVSAPSFVEAPSYTLNVDTHMDYEYPIDGWYWFDNEAQAQAELALFLPMPDLIPVQFHFLLAKYGFDDVINLILPSLKNTDINTYAIYKSYLNVARFYEFDKALLMFKEILDQFAAVNPNLAFTDDQLRMMWLEASQI